jgi:hypothetical protein
VPNDRAARGDFIGVAELHDQRWIAGSGEDRTMGVWPGPDDWREIATPPAIGWSNCTRLPPAAVSPPHQRSSPRAGRSPKIVTSDHLICTSLSTSLETWRPAPNGGSASVLLDPPIAQRNAI